MNLLEMTEDYQIICDELNERIDPGKIKGKFNDSGTDEHSIARIDHPFGTVVIFALLTRWKGKSIRLVDDLHDDLGYLEVTRILLLEYNIAYPCIGRDCLRFKFT